MVAIHNRVFYSISFFNSLSMSKNLHGFWAHAKNNSLFEPLFSNQRPDRKDGLLLGPSESEDLSLFERKWKINFFFKVKIFRKNFNY